MEIKKVIGRIILWGPVSASLVLILGSCAPTPASFNSAGWTIDVDIQKELLTISHEKLGPVLNGAGLGIKENEGIQKLSHWTKEIEENKLSIICDAPVNVTWTFSLSNEDVDITCSSSSALLMADAPSGDSRIPARLEAQDNGIMYTSIGLVTATNIRSLFDCKSNIMICFPEGSQMKRKQPDRELMDVLIPIKEGREITLIPDYYKEILGLKYYQPISSTFKTAPVGWCSWYCYYMGTTEENMVTETDALARHLKAYGLDYVQLDACFTRGEEANYLEWTKEAFPQGGKWVFQYVKDKGLKPGLWVNIYGSNYTKAECAEKYPENFYLRDLEGNLSGACCTADKTVVRLDYTNPDVIEKHLKPMFRIFKEEWGLEYLKDAGWGTWMDYYEKNKENAFNPEMGSREAYVAAQKALRETLGPDIFITGCAMHEVGLGFGIFDASRTGGDDRAVWYPERERGMSMQTYFHSLFGTNYLNNITWFCDPDTVMVRNPLTLDEARTIVTTIALTGQLYMASDFMDQLPLRRLELYKKTMPTTPVVPIDLYPYKIENNKREGVVWCCPRVKEFPRAIDLKVNSITGDYDVVALFNWADEEQSMTITFDGDLGLDPGNFVVFDFWNQTLVGYINDSISSEIPAHGTSVFFIRRVLDRPQVVAASRHITGYVSIKQIDWDEENTALVGVSEVPAEAPYSIFIHVPEGMSVTKVEADQEILYHKVEDNLLEIKFAGYPEREDAQTINWSVVF